MLLVVRRGERPLRRHLGEVTKLINSKGRGLRTNFEVVGRSPDYISSGKGGFSVT